MAKCGAKADSAPVTAVSLVKWSEYLMKLLLEAKKRFESKVVSAGVNVDPCAIDKWSQDPEDLPKVQWSDVMLYMVSTPSPYTKEAIKVVN